MFLCQTCGRSYKQKVTFHRHLKTHKRPLLLTSRQQTDFRSQNVIATAVEITAQQIADDSSGHFVDEQSQSSLRPSASNENLEDKIEDDTISEINSVDIEDNTGYPGSRDYSYEMQHLLSQNDRTFNSIGIPGLSQNMALEIFRFFDSYGDRSIELFPKRSVLVPQFDSLHESCVDILSHCSANTLTLGESRSLYRLQTKLESRNPEHLRPISRQFKDEQAFASYLDSLRKWTVRKEGWRKVLIETDFGLNDTAVYRSVKDLLLQQLDEAGGLSAIIPYAECSRDGERVYFSPWSADAMMEYQRCIPAEKMIFIDVYSDGATMSKSGSQSFNAIRVRFSNVSGISDIWHEVGIAPTVRAYQNKHSDAEIRRERLEIFQRYIFHLFRDLMTASFEGVLFQGKTIYPVVLMIVADQPQERLFFSLKKADSYKDCSLCLMPSRIRGESNQVRFSEDRGQEPVQVKKMKRGIRIDGVHESESSRQTGSFLVQYDTETSGEGPSPGELTDCRPHVSQIQTTHVNYEGRNVETTLSSQLILAICRRDAVQMKGAARANLIGKKQRAKSFLENSSAQEYPPAIAAFNGLGCKPFRLYRSIAFDKLHAFDLGPLRQIPDTVYKVLQTKDVYNECSRTEYVSIMNQRMLDVPRSARLERNTPFRNQSGEKHAGMSGKIRRNEAPFLWYCVMGLASNTKPDEDDLLQVCLMWDDIQRRLCGTNMSREKRMRNKNEIEELQRSCFEAGKLMVEVLQVPVNTKLHRIMRHIKDHLFDYGDLRKGATDQNETMHKETKEAYRSTNHHLSTIAPQLLSARVKISCETVSEDASRLQQERILLTRMPRSKMCGTRNASLVDATPSAPGERHSSIENRSPLNSTEIDNIRAQVSESMSTEEIESTVLNIKHRSTHCELWVKKKSAAFEARFPWCQTDRDTEVSCIVYAGEYVFGSENRRDAVQYQGGNEKQVGVIQALIQHTSEKLQVALMRRLTEVSPESGNMNVVNLYGNRRFKYVCNATDIVIDVVPVSAFVCPVMLVPDPWSAVQRYGVRQRLNKIPDDINARKHMYFFEVAGYRYSSIGEETC